MATLEKIRSKAVLLVTVVGIALFSFIIGDLLRSGSTFLNQKKENIAVINGEAIHYRDYQAKVEDRINTIRNNRQSLTDDYQHQIRQIVLNEMIDNILLSKETKKMGLVVSKEEYKDLVMGNNISPILQQIPYFQNPQTKKFDKTALLQFLQAIENDDYSVYSSEQISQLTSMKKVWLNIEEQIIKEQLKKKFNILFASAILANNMEAKALYEDSKISVDFDYVTQSYTSIPDKEVNVSDAEIQKLYNERKNLYKQQEATQIDYIAANIAPSSDDYRIIENKLKGLKEQLQSSENIAEIVQNNSDIPYTDAYVSYNDLNENQKTFVDKNPIGSVGEFLLTGQTYNLYKFEGTKIAPDSIKLNALIIPATKNETDFVHLTDSLIQVVKNGTSFADMASAMSKGKTTGELGWMTEIQLVSQVNVQCKDAILAAKIGEPTLIKSDIGTFLIQVVEKTQPIKKYKIANIQVRVVPSQETKTRLYNELSQFISANHSPTALKENASKAGFSIQTDVEITKDQININGIQDTRKVIQWAFNNKKGTISDIYECQNGEYFMVIVVKEHLQEGYRLLASVSDILKRDLIDKKKGEKLVADLKAKKLNTLEQYAEVMSTTPQSVKSVNFATFYISNIGVEPILNIKATEAPINQVSEPYAGKNKVYILYVTDKRVNEDVYDAERFRRQVQMQNMHHVYQAIQTSDFLRENAKIDNHFNRFF